MNAKNKIPCYIFLDIDGVIATPELIEEGTWGLVPEKQYLLGIIIKETDAKIVLSSSWRMNNLEDTIKYMQEKGFRFCDRIVGITIRACQYIEEGINLSIPRGVEIKQWIDNNIHSELGKNYKRKKVGKDFNYVILDDDSDMLLEQAKHFVKCYSMDGLTMCKVRLAINILNSK